MLRVTNCHVSRGDTGIGTFNVETMDMFCVKQVSDYFYPDVIEILEAVGDGVQSGHPAASAANTNMRIDSIKVYNCAVSAHRESSQIMCR